MPNHALVKVGPGSRQADNQINARFTLKSSSISWAWGTEPAQATLTYVPKASPWAGAAVGARVQIELGGYTFWGYCRSDKPVESSGGHTRTIEFIDNRDFLKWDKVFGAFNMPDRTTISGSTLKRYWHILPWDFPLMEKTYTLAPYTAREILNFLFNAPTIRDRWRRIYHPDQRSPVYEVDLLGGETLQSAVARITEAQGLVCTLIGAPFQIGWARKGYGPPITIPPTSDDRELSESVTDNPTAVRVLGDRVLYQVHDIELVPDWAASWQQFYDPSLFVEDIYRRAACKTEIKIGVQTFAAGTPFKTIGAHPSDPEQIIARLYARSMAYEITVNEYAELRGDPLFLDYRRYAGRSRSDMPAILYINQILFRAFRLPDDFTLQTPYGLIPANSLRVAGKMVARVTHDPVTGEMGWNTGENPDGNGYAIVQGYQVGKDLFTTINPDRFDPTQWQEIAKIWEHHQIQFDDNGGSEAITVLFDEPVIKMSDLVDFVDGYAVMKAEPNFNQIPAVRAALPLLGERFNYFLGRDIREHCENVSGLNAEYVVSVLDPVNTLQEVPFSDGYLATEKAHEIADSILQRQQVYASGRFRNPINPLPDGSYPPPIQLTGLIDRVTVDWGTDGFFETAYLTNEQPREFFIPERDLDRGAQMEQLFPGQREMQAMSHTARLMAAALRTNPDAKKLVQDSLFYVNGGFQAVDNIPLQAGTGTLPVGAPLWKKPNELVSGKHTNTLAMLPANAGDDAVEFAGFTLRNGEPMSTDGRGIFAVKQGVVLGRVKGPVSPGDVVGKKSNVDYLVPDSSVPVGKALQEVATGQTVLIKVQIGAAAGGSDVSHPFQIVKAGNSSVQVKTGYCLKTLDTHDFQKIVGLNKVFDIASNDCIYLEILFDKNGAPFQCHVCAALEWDGNTFSKMVKNVLKSEVDAEKDLLDVAAITWQGISGPDRDNDLAIAKGKLEEFKTASGNRRHFKSFILIGHAIKATDAKGLDMIELGTDEPYVVVQSLNTHILLQDICFNGIAAQAPMPYYHPKLRKLPDVVFDPDPPAAGVDLTLSVPGHEPGGDSYAEVFWTLDGSDPDPNTSQSGRVISSDLFTTGVTIKAIAIQYGWYNSNIKSAVSL